MKKVSICIPCYNEEKNIPILINEIYKSIDGLDYDFEIIFTDNSSKDNSVSILREYAQKDLRIKILVNNRNYGIDGRSGRNTFKYVSGDVIVCIAGDCQDPPELIPEFLRYWEEGYKVVCGQKVGSEEGKIKYGLRSLYYKIIQAMSDVPQIEHISGITLFDREVLEEWLKTDYDYYLRFALADMGYEIKLIPYVQRARKNGKSSYNIWRSLTFSINSLVNTSTTPLRLMTIIGLMLSLITFVVGIVYLVLKLRFWHMFSAGTAPVLIGLFFVGSIQLLMIGILGEYISVLLRKITRRPDVILKEKINFDDSFKNN